MENNIKLMESMAENAVNLGKNSLELLKLKALEKTTDLASSLFPHSIVVIIVIIASLFINLGLAIWLSYVLGIAWLGFFVVGGFYVIIGIVIHFFIHKWMKERIGNFIIKQLMK